MEYEYSFYVSDINEYIDFCNKNNFLFSKKVKQTRTIYRHENKTIARITTEEGENVTKMLDFKEDKISSNDLNIRKESASISFDDENEVKSILDFLEYKKDNTIIRTRTVYKKENIKFEIDEYEYPKKCFVVAIEGEKMATDLIYKELSDLNKKFKIVNNKKI